MDGVYQTTTRKAQAVDFFNAYFYTKRTMAALAVLFFICFLLSLWHKSSRNDTPVTVSVREMTIKDGTTTITISCSNKAIEEKEQVIEEKEQKMDTRFENKDKKYVLRYYNVNWFEALELCFAEGYRLATVMDAKETEKLNSVLRESSTSLERAWLAGTDLGREGKFFWLSTGQPVSYTNWAQPYAVDDPLHPIITQPDNHKGSEHCMEVWNFTQQGLVWNDQNCNNANPFVCEYF